jgi:hypothetical protein
MSITPRVIRAQTRPSSETTEFWYGSESQTRSGPFASGGPTGSPGGGPIGPGGVSFGAGGGSSSVAAAAPSSGSRAVPERIAAAARPPPPPADAAAAGAPAQDAAADARPKVVIEGPDTAKVGEEVNVSVKLASTSALGRIRTQVGFDAAALQLVSAEAGDLASSGDAPKVDVKPGGVQLEVATEGAPVSGAGSLLNLRFRVVAARPEIAVATQVVLVGQDGAAVAATQATPLKIAVAQ